MLIVVTDGATVKTMMKVIVTMKITILLSTTTTKKRKFITCGVNSL